MPHPVQHKRIVRREPQVDPAELPDSLPAVLRRVYAARGIRRPEELEHVLNRLHRPEQLGGLATAVDLLEQALVNDRRILIVGDFDADGATSSALCVRALRALGARQVDFLVPNRFEYGYGLTPEIVGVALERRPDLIMTVDNGVSSHQGVAAAQAAGVQVLVTDHHLNVHLSVRLGGPRGFQSPKCDGVDVTLPTEVATLPPNRSKGSDQTPFLALC